MHLGSREPFGTQKREDIPKGQGCWMPCRTQGSTTERPAEEHCCCHQQMKRRVLNVAYRASRGWQILLKDWPWGLSEMEQRDGGYIEFTKSKFSAPQLSINSRKFHPTAAQQPRRSDAQRCPQHNSTTDDQNKIERPPQHHSKPIVLLMRSHLLMTKTTCL